MSYASGTTVSVERSRAELERLLRQHGATQFVSAWDEERGLSIFGFTMHDRQVRMEVYDPDPACFAETDGGRKRKPEQIERELEKERRRQWRVLILLAKAKLEVIASGDSSVEREFMADLVLPTGKTMEAWAAPQLAVMYRDGKMPPLLPGGGA